VEGYHGIGSFGDPSCGDSLEMTVRISDDDFVTDVGYLVYGCAGAIATSSMVSELIKGKDIRSALKVTAQDVVTALNGIPEQKIHCSLIGLEAFKLALSDALFGRKLIQEGKISGYDEYRSLRQSGKIRFELRPVEASGEGR
jgi:nitrogen fixation NifU-like protein